MQCNAGARNATDGGVPRARSIDRVGRFDRVGDEAKQPWGAAGGWVESFWQLGRHDQTKWPVVQRGWLPTARAARAPGHVMLRAARWSLVAALPFCLRARPVIQRACEQRTARGVLA